MSPERKINLGYPERPTDRELEVLQLIADGLSNAKAARELRIAEETVKKHVQHSLAKLNAENRAHAVAVAIRRGLIS